MSKNQNLFSDFSPLTKEEWENKVVKELKGKPLADMQWQLGAEVKIKPLYQKEDAKSQFSALGLDRDSNDWEIGEDFKVGEAKKTNKELLEALQDGVNAPCLVWKGVSEKESLSDLLHKIEAKYISTHFSISQNQLELLKEFCALQKEKGQDTHQLLGSINGSLLTPDGEGLALLRYAIAELPQFKVLSINGHDLFQGPQNVVEELAGLLHRCSETIYGAGQAGISPAEAAPRIQFSLLIGTSYFVDLAKIRALRLLWSLLLKAYEVEEVPVAAISVRLAADTQIEDQELNMIRASTQAMSAVLGGASRLTILPANAYAQEENAFTRRIARNVQHLLKMESYLDRVSDPAAGSYYIDELTHQLAEQAWKKFQELTTK